TKPVITGSLASVDVTGCSADLTTLYPAKTTIEGLASLGLTISDNCTANEDLTVSSSESNTGSCPIVVTRTYTVTDKCGNSETIDQTINVKVDPTIIITGGTKAKKVNCLADAVAPHTLEPSVMPTVTDACGTTIATYTSVVDDKAEFEGCEGTVTYTYTYTNCAGATNTWAFTYTVDVPDLTIPADGEGNLVCEKDTVRPTPEDLTDMCGNVFKAKQNGHQVSTVDATGNGTVTYNYTYTDCVGKTYPWKFVYNVKADAFIAPANTDSDLHCVAELKAPTLPNTKVCGEDIEWGEPTIDDKATETGCGDVTYTYSYVVNDTPYTWKHTYHVSPLDFESIMPANGEETIACFRDVVEPTAKLPVVTDACGRTLSPIGAPTKTEDKLCGGDVVYTYTYKDCAGNTHDWTYTYHVSEPAAPALTGSWPTSNTEIEGCYSEIPTFLTNEEAAAKYTAVCGKT
nr:hypothetical protein [Fibrobacter sp.]